MAAHPEQNLLAAGHDSGLIVFKLERERPAYGGANGSLFYVKDRYLRRCVLGSGIDVPVLSIRRSGSTRNFGTSPRSLLLNPYNPSEDNILIFSLVEGGTYELYCLNQVRSLTGACVVSAGLCWSLTLVSVACLPFCRSHVLCPRTA
jgi:coatomer protein complex subunit alpha (xenin)